MAMDKWYILVFHEGHPPEVVVASARLAKKYASQNNETSNSLSEQISVPFWFSLLVCASGQREPMCRETIEEAFHVGRKRRVSVLGSRSTLPFSLTLRSM